MARMMRRLAEASGEPMTPTMDEMFRRLEAGEDPDALEEELGPQLEAETGAGEAVRAAPPHPRRRSVRAVARQAGRAEVPPCRTSASLGRPPR